MKQKVVTVLAVLLVVVVSVGTLTGMTAAGALEPANPNPNATEFVPNEVDLYFPSNPTTGYDWQAEAEDADVVAIRDQFFEAQHEDGLVGVGGTHWFHLAGLKPGTTSVTFRYVRPWEDSPIRETLYRLTVDERGNVLIWGVEVSNLG